MASGRHKAARHRAPRSGHAKRLVPLVAAVAAASVIGATVAGGDEATQVTGLAVPPTWVDDRSTVAPSTSRSSSRAPVTAPSPAPQDKRRSPAPRAAVATAAAEPVIERVPESAIVDQMFMTADLNVWSGPGEQYTLLTTLPAGTKVSVTGEVAARQWAQISRGGVSRWVNADYLVTERPEPEPKPDADVDEPVDEPTDEPADEPVADTGLSGEPCASGSDVEAGLTPDAIAVHRAVCAAFPSITTYGGLRSDGEHGEGRALDIMVSGSLGDQVAEFVRANAGALGASEVIWSQQIWTVERSSEGWRAMEDRGSTTANHYDHVHVTVYGFSAG